MMDLQENERDALALARQVLASLRPDVAAALRELTSGLERQNLRPHRATGRPPGVQLKGAAEQLKDRAWLEGQYASKSAEMIGAEVGCNPKTVLNWLRKHGIETRNPTQTADMKGEGAREARRAAVLAALRDLVTTTGQVPTATEWDRLRPDGVPSHKGVRLLFGSWDAALVEIGMRANPPGPTPVALRVRRASQMRAVLDGLREWAAEHDGESPTCTEWDDSRPAGAPASGTVRRLFGTYPDAVKAAGLQPLRPGEKKNIYNATVKGKTPKANRQMVTGKGLSDHLPGTVKHFGDGMRDAA